MALPNDKVGKEILLKITDYENYWFLQSENTAEKDKMFFCVNYIKAIGQLYLRYNQNRSKTNGVLNYGDEMLAIHKTMLNLTDKMIETADKFIIDHPDLTEIQKNGLQKMKHGLNNIISGTFSIITREFTEYTKNDICDLSKVFFDFYKKNRNSIDEISKNQFDNECINLHKNHKIECVRNSASIK